MTEFAGKTVLIAGGATMIGQVIGTAFHANGAKVALADINDEPGQAGAAAIGDGALYLRMDLSDDASIEAGVAKVAATFGGIDILINAACTYVDGGAESTREQWIEGLNINVIGMARLVATVRPLMRARGGGAVVNLGSVAGKGARADTLVYPVSKAAVLHMTKCLAMQLAPDNIRVNSVSPGWTWSRPLVERTGNDRAWAERAAEGLHMLRRLANPEELAEAVMFLASPRASFVTGTDLAADGGYAALGVDGGISSGNVLKRHAP